MFTVTKLRIRTYGFQPCERIRRFPIFRIETDRFGEIGDSFFILPLGIETNAAFVVSPFFFRIEADRFSEIIYRFVILVLSAVRYTTVDVRD